MLKLAGQVKSIASADWIYSARLYLDKYITERVQQEFMAEDLRNWAITNGCQIPADGRAWGGVILGAVNAGRIKRIGFAPMKSRNCHANPKSVWVIV